MTQEIELPDGTVLEAPDGADPSVVAKKYLAARRSAKARATTLLGRNWNTPGLAGAGARLAGTGKQILEGAANIASGTVAYPAGNLAGLGGIIADATGLMPNDPGETEAKVAQALTYQPSEPNALATVGSIPGRLISGAGKLLGRVPGIEGTPYVQSIAERFPEAVVNAITLAQAIKARSAPKQPTRAPTEAERAAGELEAAGVPTYRYQVSDSQTLKNAQAAADQLPFSGMRKALEVQSEAFNRKALELAGDESGAKLATPGVMGRLQDKLGAALDSVENNAEIPFSTDLASGFQRVLSEAPTTEVRDFVNRQITGIAQDAVAQNGALSGNAFAAWKRKLDGFSGSSNTDIGNAARGLRSALQDELGRVLPPETSALYSQTRSQYKMMKQIEGAIAPDYNISPRRLANIFKQKANRYQGIYGKGEQSLAELARSGSQILPESVPNSGTSVRGLYTGLLGGGAILAPKLAAIAAISGTSLPRLLRNLPSGAGGPMAPPVPPSLFINNSMLRTPILQYDEKGRPVLNQEERRSLAAVLNKAGATVSSGAR